MIKVDVSLLTTPGNTNRKLKTTNSNLKLRFEFNSEPNGRLWGWAQHRWLGYEQKNRSALNETPCAQLASRANLRCAEYDSCRTHATTQHQCDKLFPFDPLKIAVLFRLFSKRSTKLIRCKM